MRQADDPRWDGEEPGQAGRNGCQQAHNERLDDSGLAVVAIPVSLRLICDEAKRDSDGHGEQRAGAESGQLPAEEHGIHGDGEKGDARVEPKVLAESSVGGMSAVRRRGIRG